MKRVENKQGFLILEVSKAVLIEATGGYSKGICDNCEKPVPTGYYIAALNQWFCPECYERWISRAVRYVADIPIEEKRFKFYELLFRKAEQKLC